MSCSMVEKWLLVLCGITELVLCGSYQCGLQFYVHIRNCKTAHYILFDFFKFCTPVFIDKPLLQNGCQKHSYKPFTPEPSSSGTKNITML